ncbi:hypothetical protein [Nisaea sp.]|uniref:hypothetical protein n=1 Tax=Nisaea sp. TaxID=2024842 RepID=UPI0032ECAA49
MDQIRDLSVALVRYEKTSQILDHWLELLDAEGAGTVPPFDPIAVPALLPFLYLLQREDDRLKYRVSGEEVNRLFEQNHTGRYLDEVVPGEVYGHVAPFFLRIFDPSVCIFRGQVVLPDREFMEFERVLLPVMRKGEIQLLGTLALSTTSPLRTDVEPAQAPGPGFHFTLIDLKSGAIERTHKNLAPLAQRYKAVNGLRG